MAVEKLPQQVGATQNRKLLTRIAIAYILQHRITMDRHEEAVMHLLTANGETFVAHEFEIGDGWSRPDFVAIRPPRKKIYIVEVTTSGNPASLIERANNRETQWLTPLRSHLEDLHIIDATWKFSILLFVRQDQLDFVKKKINDRSGVSVLRLEDASFNWNWRDEVWHRDFSFENHEIIRAVVS